MSGPWSEGFLMTNKQIKVYLGLRTSLIFLFYTTVFPASTPFTSMSSLFCFTREWDRFLQRGEVTDVTEDGGCKTCNLANKQQENKFRLYLRGLAGGKRKL